MSKYIKADEVISLFEEYHYSLATRVSEFGYALRELPTADAVEVVHCEECIHDDKCRIQDYLWGYDDYCSRGERKTE